MRRLRQELLDTNAIIDTNGEIDAGQKCQKCESAKVLQKASSNSWRPVRPGRSSSESRKFGVQLGQGVGAGFLNPVYGPKAWATDAARNFRGIHSFGAANFEEKRYDLQDVESSKDKTRRFNLKITINAFCTSSCILVFFSEDPELS